MKSETLQKPTNFMWEIRGNDLWELAGKAEITVKSSAPKDRGVGDKFCYTAYPGYTTDFRSGTSIINPVIPKIGDSKTALAWAVHDINYHGFVSKAVADDLLKAMLIESGMSRIKAALVHFAVSKFGKGHYSNLEDDQGPIYNRNKELIHFRWDGFTY